METEPIGWGPGQARVSQCASCSRKRPGPHCDAFPGAPIPDPILMNRHDHRRAYPGDGGLRFEPRPGPPGTARPAGAPG